MEVFICESKTEVWVEDFRSCQAHLHSCARRYVLEYNKKVKVQSEVFFLSEWFIRADVRTWLHQVVSIFKHKIQQCNAALICNTHTQT